MSSTQNTKQMFDLPALILVLFTFIDFFPCQEFIFKKKKIISIIKVVTLQQEKNKLL